MLVQLSNFFKRTMVAFILIGATGVWAKEHYSIGVVPQFEARKIHEIWHPILEQLESRTGFEFSLEGAPTIPAFEKKLLSGEFDFAYMNPFHLVLANEAQGYTPLIRDTSRKLSGILVVRKDSGITSPKDLDGKELAFPAPNALGASLQMRQELTDLFGISFTPKYVRTHDSVYLNVMLNKAAAGGGVKKTLGKQKKGIQDQLKVVHSTKPVSPHPLAAHPRVSNSVTDKITQAFLALASTEEGKSLLSKIPMKQIGHASLSDYEELKSMKLNRFYVAPQ